MTAHHSPNSAGTAMAGFILGAATGVALGMLVAPKSGKETREQLQKKAHELKDKAKDMKDKTQEKIASKKEDVKDAADEISEQSKKSVAEGRQAIRRMQENNRS